MSLTRFFMTLTRGGSATTESTFDDTQVFSLKQEYALSGRYLFTGTLAKNPVTGNVLHTFFNGTKHTFEVGKKASGRRSTDGGATFGPVFDFALPTASTGIQDVAGGYSANGRRHEFYDLHESHTAGTQHWLMYTYSDDDGLTWSAPVDVGLPPNGHKTFRVIGKVIENNGVLMKPVYTAPDEGSFLTQSARYVLRSPNGGGQWDWVLVEQGAEYINESSMIAHGNEVLYVSRREIQTTAANSQRFKVYKSADNGLTWAVQGYTGFGETFAFPHPPHLEKFKIEGVDVAACYFVNRDTKQYKVVYGRLADVMAGISGWNLNTKFTLLDHDSYTSGGTPDARSGYGSFFHVNDTLEAKGISYVDYGLTVATSILYFDLPTTHYQNLKSQLGIVAT